MIRIAKKSEKSEKGLKRAVKPKCAKRTKWQKSPHKNTQKGALDHNVLVRITYRDAAPTCNLSIFILHCVFEKLSPDNIFFIVVPAPKTHDMESYTTTCRPHRPPPVIRQKLGAMVAQLEGVQNWLENLTYQMVTMAPEVRWSLE